MFELIKISQEDVATMIKSIYEIVNGKEKYLSKKLFINIEHSGVGMVTLSRFGNMYNLVGGVYSNSLDGRDDIYNCYIQYGNSVGIETIATDLVESLNKMYSHFGSSYRVHMPESLNDTKLVKIVKDEDPPQFDYCFFVPDKNKEKE